METLAKVELQKHPQQRFCNKNRKTIAQNGKVLLYGRDKLIQQLVIWTSTLQLDIYLKLQLVMEQIEMNDFIVFYGCQTFEGMLCNDIQLKWFRRKDCGHYSFVHEHETIYLTPIAAAVLGGIGPGCEHTQKMSLHTLKDFSQTYSLLPLRSAWTRKSISVGVHYVLCVPGFTVSPDPYSSTTVIFKRPGQSG